MSAPNFAPSRLGGRLALLSEDSLNDAQRRVHEQLEQLTGPESKHEGYVSQLRDGRFIGPFNAMLRVPQLTAGFGSWVREIGRLAVSDEVRQVIILTVGARWRAEYAIYAHIAGARVAGVPEAAITAILKGEPPVHVSAEAALAYNLTTNLVHNHDVPDRVYEECLQVWGVEVLITILSLIGQYQMISSLLVCFRVPAPDIADPPHRPDLVSTTKSTTTTTEIVAPAESERAALDLRKRDLPAPGAGQLLVTVRAAGVNPTDWKNAHGSWPRSEPVPVGFEAAGVVAAVGDGLTDEEIRLGDEVIVFPVPGAYATQLLVQVGDVFRRPATLDPAQAANLLLVGTTAAEMIAVAGVRQQQTVVVHGASGATGTSLVQQLRHLGARVIGTGSDRSADRIRAAGGEPVPYGPGLEQRIRKLAPDGIDASLDCVGTDEAIDVSLALTPDRSKIVTIANRERAAREGIRHLEGRDPESLAYRGQQRQRLVDLAAAGVLTVPMGRVLPLTVAGAQEAFRLLQDGHPGGKLALVPQ